jgi:hypothetical protein
MRGAEIRQSRSPIVVRRRAFEPLRRQTDAVCVLACADHLGTRSEKLVADTEHGAAVRLFLRVDDRIDLRPAGARHETDGEAADEHTGHATSGLV